MKTEERRLFKEIASILWNDWDPIGVNDGENDWDDEYDSYVPNIFRLALEGRDASRIALSLSSSIEQNMGLSASPQHDLKIAHKIVEAKVRIFG
ncbi:hypothetical protein C4G84_RS28745 [Vibrio parahaemolyticus O5:K30]|nr:hypothetical protein [Vibrio parahaemolyticus O5:K30]ELA9213943.1 hypothetical protein [Vibrio parahaemolyticus]